MHNNVLIALKLPPPIDHDASIMNAHSVARISLQAATHVLIRESRVARDDLQRIFVGKFLGQFPFGIQRFPRG